MATQSSPAPGVFADDVRAFLVGGDGSTAAGASNPLPMSSTDRILSVLGTTLTRPANTTAYSAGDSISDNATAGSVTAMPVTVSDANDAPLGLTEIELDTNDTGLSAGIQVDVFVYNQDPTASSGVGGGDNAAFSNKRSPEQLVPTMPSRRPAP